METSPAKKTTVRIAVIDSDPLRFLGFRALLSSEIDFELQSVSLTEIGAHPEEGVALLGSHPGRNVLEVLTTLKALRPGLDCHRDGTQYGRSCNPEGDRSWRERLCRRGCIGRRTRASNSNCTGWVGLGSKAGSRHVRGAGIPILEPRSLCGPTTVHNPGKRSTQDAGGGLHKQGNRCSSWNRRAHGESSRSQTPAKGRSTESRHAFCARDYALTDLVHRVNGSRSSTSATTSDNWPIGVVKNPTEAYEVRDD